MKTRGLKRVICILLAAVCCMMTVCTGPVEARAEQMDTFVVVLDAGHGGTDGGACRTWSGKKYMEKKLNLEIAKYCKQELEQYVGVKVYLTRSTDMYVGLEDRVYYAKKRGADLFVCLHNNADYRSSVNGACVFYPNYNYKKQIGVEGRMVAQSIQSQLVGLGLKNRGIAYRNSEDKTFYPDKKLADYYRVIKHSKLCGFPGVIVEHAFVSNPSDCKNFLSSEAKLKKLGKADATGIAKAYGLVKGYGPVLESALLGQDGTVELQWQKGKGLDGYAVCRRVQGEKTYTVLAVLEGIRTTKYTDTTAAGGVTYEYNVRGYAIGKGIKRYTDESNRLQITTLGSPSLVTVSRSEDGALQVSFTLVEGADGYLVARRSADEESFLVVAELDSTAEAWTDADSGPEDVYEYQVCAYVEQENMRITGAYTVGIMDTIEIE